ncbi:flagellar protein FlgN [Lysobacter sp. 2RAF19]
MRVADEARDALDALEQALAAERRALLDNDAEALLISTAEKVAALRRAEALQPDAGIAGRVAALRDANHANGVLLSRRRREVAWALRHLGRIESTPVYTATGQASARPQARPLGVG